MKLSYKIFLKMKFHTRRSYLAIIGEYNLLICFFVSLIIKDKDEQNKLISEIMNELLDLVKDTNCYTFPDLTIMMMEVIRQTIYPYFTIRGKPATVQYPWHQLLECCEQNMRNYGVACDMNLIDFIRYMLRMSYGLSRRQTDIALGYLTEGASFENYERMMNAFVRRKFEYYDEEEEDLK